MPNFKIVPKGFTILKAINVVDVVSSKLQSELFVQGIYTTNYPKHVRGTLVEENLKVMKKVGKKSLIGILTPPSTMATSGITTLSSPLESIALDSE